MLVDNEREKMDPSTIPEPLVLIINTGGTICMLDGPEGYIPGTNFLERELKPRRVFNDGTEIPDIEVCMEGGHMEKLPALRTQEANSDFGKRKARFTVLEFDPLLDSSSIDRNGWSEIAATIERNYQKFDGFVVLHGTDSMAYTCSALSFMISNLGKPIIFTGSQVPMAVTRNDGTDNLLGALLIAAHFIIPEVCLFFHNKLFRGNRTTKIAAGEVDAFDSPNLSPLATYEVAMSGPAWDSVFHPSSIASFEVLTYFDPSSCVASARIFPGITPEHLDAILNVSKIKGLILETFGSGNAPANARLLAVLQAGYNRGIVIVNVTQCLQGTVSGTYASGSALSRVGVVQGHDMTTEAALTKLTVLLSRRHPHPLSPQQIRDLMSHNLRGELSPPPESRTFAHPSGMSPRDLDLTALGRAIAEQNLPAIRAVLERSKSFLLNEVDYSGKTPLHLAATTADVHVLRYFLEKGASVHARTAREGNTPLFLACARGLRDNVNLLLETGAHLHPDEVEDAAMYADRLRRTGNGNGRLGSWEAALQGSKGAVGSPVATNTSKGDPA